jgi:hypothetical protein
MTRIVAPACPMWVPFPQAPGVTLILDAVAHRCFIATHPPPLVEVCAGPTRCATQNETPGRRRCSHVPAIGMRPEARPWYFTPDRCAARPVL